MFDRYVAAQALRAAAAHVAHTGLTRDHVSALPALAALSTVSTDFKHLATPVRIWAEIHQARDIFRAPPAAAGAAAAAAGYSVSDYTTFETVHGSACTKRVGGLVIKVSTHMYLDSSVTVSYGGFWASFSDNGRSTVSFGGRKPTKAALATIRTIVWPAFRAAFGLGAADQRKFEAAAAAAEAS